MLALYARSVVRDDGWPEKNERVEQQQQQKGEKIFLILYTCPSAMHNKDGSIVYIYPEQQPKNIYQQHVLCCYIPSASQNVSRSLYVDHLL
jgi:hypothetical protein